MEFLDNEEKAIVVDPKGNTLGTIGGIAFALGGIGCIIYMYGYSLAFNALNSNGAPDATQLSKGIKIALYCQATIPIFIIGIICQSIAFGNYHFSPKWLWYVMLVSGLLAIIASIRPFHPVFLIVGIAILAQIFIKRAAYFPSDEEDD